MSYTNGYLELFIGPMFSGKTSKLIEIYKQCKICDINVLVINHSSDDRYSKKQLCSHDNIGIDCIRSDRLSKCISENMNLMTNPKSLVILINEGQFFPDLYVCVEEMINKYKRQVYVAGLDGDFNRKKFGEMLDLIPICDKVEKLQSLCVKCKNGTKASFSYRLNDSKEQKQIGMSDKYIALCRKCYDEKIK